jgi:tetratricopeptide (TPR) repeat protein
LVDVSTGWQLWGETFDCEIKDVLEIQDVITRQLLATLKLQLSGDEEKRITARYTENAEAYQCYLEGRYHWSKYTRKGIEKAIGHFRRAIELDPNYALAYAGIVDCYLRLATNYLPPEEDLPRSEVEISREGAQSDTTVDDTDAKIKLRFEWDWKTAERELRRANELKTDYPAAHQWYAAYRIAKDLLEKSTGKSHDSDCKLPAQIVAGAPTPAERVQVLCTVAREQIAVGNYDAAELILQPWHPQNDWPKINLLTPHAAADLLFTLGALIGSIGATKRTARGQKHAEAFLSGAVALFENLGTKSRAAEARMELGRCYYRQGLFDIARESFSAALAECPDDELEIKCLCLIFWGLMERDSGRLSDSIVRLREAAALEVTGRLLKGRCHLELGATLKDLAVAECQDSYNDEAKASYNTALYEFEAIGHHRIVATVENNLGFLLLNLGFTAESKTHLLRALRFFEVLSDSFRRAQVNDTLARLYIATCQYSLAHGAIEDAVRTLELTDGEAVLSEALTTSGVVLCRLGSSGEARKRFEAADKVAERCGDREGSRRALVSMFEEMGDHLETDELLKMADKLRRLLCTTEESSLAARVQQTIGHIDSMTSKG